MGKWYFKTSVLIIAFLCIGPLVLPLVWFNPRFNLKMKIAISTAMIIVSYYLAVVFIHSLKSIYNYYKLLSF
jgi:hypothetical protein